MAIVLAALAFLSKVLDLFNPWSGYWMEKTKARDLRKIDAKRRMTEAAQSGDFDKFDNARSDKYGA